MFSIVVNINLRHWVCIVAVPMRSNVCVKADNAQVEYDSMLFVSELMILQCVTVMVGDTFLTAQEISMMISMMM